MVSNKTKLGVHTIPSYVLFRVLFGDIVAPFSDDEA
jgi:hypothetical protein